MSTIFFLICSILVCCSSASWLYVISEVKRTIFFNFWGRVSTFVCSSLLTLMCFSTALTTSSSTLPSLSSSSSSSSSSAVYFSPTTNDIDVRRRPLDDRRPLSRSDQLHLLRQVVDYGVNASNFLFDVIEPRLFKQGNTTRNLFFETIFSRLDSGITLHLMFPAQKLLKPFTKLFNTDQSEAFFSNEFLFRSGDRPQRPGSRRGLFQLSAIAHQTVGALWIRFDIGTHSTSRRVSLIKLVSSFHASFSSSLQRSVSLGAVFRTEFFENWGLSSWPNR